MLVWAANFHNSAWIFWTIEQWPIYKNIRSKFLPYPYPQHVRSFSSYSNVWLTHYPVSTVSTVNTLSTLWIPQTKRVFITLSHEQYICKRSCLFKYIWSSILLFIWFQVNNINSPNWNCIYNCDCICNLSIFNICLHTKNTKSLIVIEIFFVHVFVSIFNICLQVHNLLYLSAGEQHKLLDCDQPHQHLLSPRNHPLHAPHEGINGKELSSFCFLFFFYMLWTFFSGRLAQLVTKCALRFDWLLRADHVEETKYLSQNWVILYKRMGFAGLGGNLPTCLRPFPLCHPVHPPGHCQVRSNSQNAIIVFLNAPLLSARLPTWKSSASCNKEGKALFPRADPLQSKKEKHNMLKIFHRILWYFKVSISFIVFLLRLPVQHQIFSQTTFCFSDVVPSVRGIDVEVGSWWRCFLSSSSPGFHSTSSTCLKTSSWRWACLHRYSLERNEKHRRCIAGRGTPLPTSLATW